MNEMIAERRDNSRVWHTLDNLFSILMNASESEFAASGAGLTNDELKGVC